MSFQILAKSVLAICLVNLVMDLRSIKDKSEVVSTSQGPTRGEIWTSKNGRPFSHFRSVPYAKPPVGKKRFKLPQPLGSEDSWTGVKDFNQLQDCVYSKLGREVGGEDCLVLHISTPSLTPPSPLPVIVFIHGGGFLGGESQDKGPNYFLDQDIVLVSIQYRQGILGFLSFENEYVQGNQGLWDQRQALIWIKQEIINFGGNPDLVTIYGESAGAMSVSLHLTSEYSAGLFHRAIMHSATSLSSFMNPRRKPSYYAEKLVESLGCSSGDFGDILVCLQEASVQELLNKHLMFADECQIRSDLEWMHEAMVYPHPWVPVMDTYANRSFFPGTPENLFSSGKVADVPIMVGFNNNEGLVASTRFVVDPPYLNTFFSNFESCGPVNLYGLDPSQITENLILDSNQLLEEYLIYQGDADCNLNWSEDCHLIVDRFSDLMGDAVFIKSTHEASEYLRQNKILAYRFIFDHIGETGLSDIVSSTILENLAYFAKSLIGIITSKRFGVMHGDDLKYLFLYEDHSFFSYLNIKSKEDLAISQQMIRYWTQFAMTGTPSVDWRPVLESGPLEYWSIHNASMVNRADLGARFTRWK